MERLKRCEESQADLFVWRTLLSDPLRAEILSGSLEPKRARRGPRELAEAFADMLEPQLVG